MNAAIPASGNAGNAGAPKAFGKIGIQAVMAAAEIMKPRASEAKRPTNPYFVRSDD